MVGLGGEDLRDVRVPQHQVGVRAHGNATLAGVQVEDLGGVGAGHAHKLVLVHLAGHLTGSKDREGCRRRRGRGKLIYHLQIYM